MNLVMRVPFSFILNYLETISCVIAINSIYFPVVYLLRH